MPLILVKSTATEQKGNIVNERVFCRGAVYSIRRENVKCLKQKNSLPVPGA